MISVFLGLRGQRIGARKLLVKVFVVGGVDLSADPGPAIGGTDQTAPGGGGWLKSRSPGSVDACMSLYVCLRVSPKDSEDC